jgi:hypothetical protein
VQRDPPDAVGSAGSALQPVGGEVVGEAVDVLNGDDVLAVETPMHRARVAPTVPASTSPNAVVISRGVA